jgi:pantothenate kinase
MLNEAMSNQLLSFFIGFVPQQIFIIEDKTLNNIEKLSKSR